jgi:hypothetical protein
MEVLAVDGFGRDVHPRQQPAEQHSNYRLQPPATTPRDAVLLPFSVATSSAVIVRNQDFCSRFLKVSREAADAAPDSSVDVAQAVTVWWWTSSSW